MTKRALLVSTANPYPVVTNGCARLVSDYQRGMFPDHDVSFLLARPGDWTPLALFHDGRPVAADLRAGGLRTDDYEFVLFIGFKDNDFTRHLAGLRPSFSERLADYGIALDPQLFASNVIRRTR